MYPHTSLFHDLPQEKTVLCLTFNLLLNKICYSGFVLGMEVFVCNKQHLSYSILVADCWNNSGCDSETKVEYILWIWDLVIF